MAAATLTLLVLTLTGQAVALRSDKPFVTSEDSAQLELRVLDEAGRPLSDARVSLSVNAGSVTEPAPAQDGTFHATYRPPSQQGPLVALFHATVKRGASSSGAWLALPVHGPYSLRLQAPPRSRVQVSIGAASYGPVVTAASGEAVVPVRLPPGVTSAQVTISERSRKSRTQSVPLPAPRFPRVQLVAMETPLQGRPVRLQGFVVDDSGNPAVALPPLAVSAERGTLGPIEAKEGGVFEVPFTASTASAAPVNISASPLDEADRSSTLQVEPRPAPPGTPTGPAPPAAVASPEQHLRPPSPGSPWQPTLGAFLFGHSNTARANGAGLQLEGALRLATLPVEALVQFELRGNTAESVTLEDDRPNPVTKTFTLGGGALRLGARWSHPVLSRGLLFADASAGVLSMQGNLELTSQEGTVTEKLRSTGPDVTVGAGFAWRLGPGRVAGQVQWSYAPGTQQVSGNLGGLSVGVGYQLTLAGKPIP
ncbi:hypothetical protein [Vitiosangium sp. GDMCC 1.1324]|uniref:hypothetical protein n=1 Tax=Vitiosangium sp. (strain GDMCC 1.1324) TaxID=2138576 RepID=UPI000D33C045|nr:hypothetical protein [Vitiosangium sp. GDMCC 1.1324]PTL75763.1 hypothetical protein DAT35_52870 [Vitiosangium sp. GDMCC 1.1324]